MKKIVALMALLTLTFVDAGCSSSELSSYLLDNHSVLDIGNPNLSLLATDLKDAEVVLGGEYHAVKANYDVKFALLTAFHKQEGFKYFLTEMGYGVAGMLNLYLETGDKEILEQIQERIKGSASWTIEFSDFWEKLYHYNKELPDEQRITVIGLDIEWQLGAALDYLTTLQGADRLPVLEALGPMNREEFVNFFDGLQDDMENNPQLYADALGEDLFHFNFVVRNIATRLDIEDSHEQGMHLREQAIYDNFVKLYNFLPPGKFFGQFGMAHVYQRQCSDGMEGIERFAMALNRGDSPVKDKVISIAYMYINSKMSSWQNDYIELRVTNEFVDTQPLERVAQADYTLFRLEGENSPLQSNPYFIKGPYGGVTTDYFQYILAIRNSPAATPYGPINAQE